MYQLKVKLDSDRYGVSFIGPDEVDKFDYNSLVERIRALSRRYSYLPPEQLRVQYCDDEKCFVDLAPNDPCALVEMFRCAAIVENTDFKRVIIRVEEANSPAFSPPTKLPKRQEKRTNSCQSSRRGLFAEVPATLLSQPSTSANSINGPSCSQPATTKPSLFKSPLEKYIETLKENLQEAKSKERRVSEWLQEHLLSDKNKKSNREGPMCSNCHRREGHNRLNCPYQKCGAFFHCGDLGKHPEMKAEVKDVERQQRELQKDITSIENDLKVKEASAASIKDRYIYKVRTSLIESDPTKYLNIGADGTQVENWFQLNKDAKKLEHVLKGKTPPPGFDIQKALNESDPTVNQQVLQSGKTSVRNPYRKLWQDRGVTWPTTSTSTSTNTSVSPQSDDYMLALGIQTSLND